MIGSQGAESNFSGRFLEQQVEWLLKERGVPVVDYGDDLDNGDLFAPTKLVRGVPYTSIYGCPARSEFVLCHYERKVRIECRTQETSGSVDEKFPYLFMNARDRMPEREIVILLHGNGARPAATNWLKRECQAIGSKSIRVFDISGFGVWLKDVFKGNA